MNKAGELFEKDYNVFLHFSVAGLYFLVLSLVIFYLSSLVYKYLTRHLAVEQTSKFRFKPNFLR